MTRAEFIDGLAVLAEREPDPLGDLLAAEAYFAWSELAHEISEGLRCLEIGAGPGLFASAIAPHTGELVVLEPAGEGFSSTQVYLDRVEALGLANLAIRRERLEDHRADAPYDLIWSVNVFEHLEDWREGLGQLEALLRPGGEAIILCPNYALPYESHFSLPIIGSKAMTYRVFKSRIDRFEQENDCAGLWSSINMITIGGIRREAKVLGMDAQFDQAMTDRMFDRFEEDAELGNRHPLISGLVRLAYGMRLHRLFRVLPVDLHPYCRVVLSKPI